MRSALDNADRAADNATSNLDAPGMTAWATLALAQEMRTANLLAMLTATRPNGEPWFAPAITTPIRDDIIRRTLITPEATP